MKNKKLKIIIPVVVVVVIIIAAVLYLKLSGDKIDVETAKVTVQNIEEHFDTTGTVTSGGTKKYYLYEGIVPTEVRVSPGDTVSKGDVLATFDTSSMNGIITEKKQAVNSAQKSYDNAVSSKNDTASRAKEIDNQIAELNAQIQKLESSETTTEKVQLPERGDITLPSKGDVSLPDRDDITLPSRGDVSLPNKDSVSDAVNQRTDSIKNSKAALEAQIKILESEKALVNTSQYDTLITVYKNNLDSAKEDYNNAINAKKELDKGFIAESDGKVGDVYIKKGEPYVYVEDSSSSSSISSLLSGVDAESMTAEMTNIVSGLLGSKSQEAKSGVAMTVDSYDGYKISFSLGKYDVQTVKTGMKAKVSYTDYDYDAEVTYVSPRAGSSGLDISSAMNVTTIMGGLTSSSGSSGSTLSAEATVNNPDENLIVGFDAKLSIVTDEKKNVLAIPIEALVIDDGKKFVFVYDEKTKTAVKKEIEVGISSDKYYEVTKGLTEGDIIILNTSDVTDGAKVVVS